MYRSIRPCTKKARRSTQTDKEIFTFYPKTVLSFTAAQHFVHNPHFRAFSSLNTFHTQPARHCSKYDKYVMYVATRNQNTVQCLRQARGSRSRHHESLISSLYISKDSKLFLRRGVVTYQVNIHVTKAFQVVAYNILCGPSFHGDISPQESTLYQSGQYRYWSHRRSLVLEDLKNQDICLLTEVTEHTLNDILCSFPHSNMELAVFQPKNNFVDGSAVLYNTSRFHLLSTFSSTLCHGPHVMVLATFMDYITCHIISTVVLHLKAGHRTIDNKCRMKQIEEVMSYIKLANLPSHHLIIGGDINSASMTTYFTRHMNLRDTTPVAPIVTYAHYTHEQLDAIFVSPSISGTSIVSKVTPHAILPDEFHGSDHLPLYLTCVITDPQSNTQL